MNEIIEIKIISRVWKTHENENVARAMGQIEFLAKRAQQRVQLAIIAASGLALIAGVFIGKALFGG